MLFQFRALYVPYLAASAFEFIPVLVQAPDTSLVFPPANGIIRHVLAAPIFERALAIEEQDHVLVDGAEVERSARHFGDQSAGKVEEG
jgi:hypothetical protein